MKLAAASVHPYRLPLRSPWLTAGASVDERCGWLLCLQDDSGRRAYGDCAPLPGSGGENAPAAAQALRSLLLPLIGLTARAALERLAPDGDCPTPVARCAVETALLDLLAQGSGMPLAAYLSGTRLRHGMCSAPPPPVRINAACGSLHNLGANDIRAACNAGFAILKMKVGVLAIDDEVALLQQIATVLPPGCRLRLDANRAWPDAAATRFLQDCASLPIEMLEEPLAAPDIDRLQALQDSTTIAMAVDESIRHLDGEALVKRKVRLWVCMGDRFPRGQFDDGNGEYNVMYDTTGSIRAIHDWPTPVVFSGFEIGARIQISISARPRRAASRTRQMAEAAASMQFIGEYRPDLTP